MKLLDYLEYRKLTLRYYGRLGILSPKHENYAREYSEADLERLEQIKQLKNLNFSLVEIKQFVVFDEKYTSLDEVQKMPESDQKELLSLLKTKTSEAEEKIHNLEEGIAKLKIMIERLETLK